GHWLAEFGCGRRDIEAARQEAIQWALLRGSRSGRVAWQFARDFSGRAGPRSRLASGAPARDERAVSGQTTVSATPVVEVAAAVIEHADGSFLLAQRP